MASVRRPLVDTRAAEKSFAHKIFRLLKSKGLLSDERVELLLSFRNSGFSVDTSPTVWPQDTQGLERLCRYILRCPVSLSRIHWTPGARTLFYDLWEQPLELWGPPPAAAGLTHVSD